MNADPLAEMPVHDPLSVAACMERLQPAEPVAGFTASASALSEKVYRVEPVHPAVPAPAKSFYQVEPLEQKSIDNIFVDGRTLLAMNTESIPTLFDGLIPQVGVWALVGASDTGKSMMLRQLAICTAAGRDFVKWPCNAVYKRAIVVCSEDDENAISFLLRKQNKSLNISTDQAANIRFLFDTVDFIDKLETELQTSPADLVVIDAFGDLFDGRDLNQNNQVRGFLNKFTVLANRYKCSIGFLHHTGKRTEDLAPSKNNAIGSQGFEAKMRLVLELRSDRSQTDLRHLCIVKGNYLPQHEKQASYVVRMDENLVFSDTGNRVQFDELVQGADGQSKRNERIDPSTIDEVLHKQFIERVFKKGKQHGKNELKRLVLDSFNVGDKVGRRFVDYYEAQNWIVDVSKNPNRTAYKTNINYEDVECT